MCAEQKVLVLVFFVFFVFLLHIFSVAPSNFSDAYSTLYAPYLVFRSQIRRKEMQKGQIGNGIALRRFCCVRVKVLQPSGARRFNILSSRTVILLIPILLFRGLVGFGLITRITCTELERPPERRDHQSPKVTRLTSSRPRMAQSYTNAN
jgi:hypothetical protein